MPLMKDNHIKTLISHTPLAASSLLIKAPGTVYTNIPLSDQELRQHRKKTRDCALLLKERYREVLERLAEH